MRRMSLGLAAFFTLIASASAQSGGRAPSEAVLQKALDARCLQRMEELAAVEKDNASTIAWEISPIAVRGTFIGFVAGNNYSCALGTSQSTVPTGTIRYQEVTYEKAGKTLQAAEAEAPRPIQINDITEIFTYRDGAWR